MGPMGILNTGSSVVHRRPASTEAMCLRTFTSVVLCLEAQFALALVRTWYVGAD